MEIIFFFLKIHIKFMMRNMIHVGGIIVSMVPNAYECTVQIGHSIVLQNNEYERMRESKSVHPD
jgi:hypothetical protein